MKKLIKELKTELVNTWEGSIMRSFRDGLIVSERHLQALFFHHMQDHLEGLGLRMWVEPKLTGPDDKLACGNLMPDLLITADTKIIAFMELKYVPHGYSEYEHDRDKMWQYFQSATRDKYYLNTDLKGDWDERIIYTKHDESFGCIAVIAKSGAAALDYTSYRTSHDLKVFSPESFLLLTGTIDGSSQPKFNPPQV